MLGDTPSLPVATSARNTTPEAVIMRRPMPVDERQTSPHLAPQVSSAPDLVEKCDLAFALVPTRRHERFA